MDEAGCLLFHHDRGARREQGTGQRGDRVDQQHRCLGQNPENRTDEDQGRAVAVHSIWYRSLSTASGIVYTSHTVLGEPQTSTKPRRMPNGTAQIQLQQPPAAVGEHKVLVFQVPQKTPPRAEVDAPPLNGREAGEGNASVRLPMMSTTPNSPNLVNDAPRLRGPAAGG